MERQPQARNISKVRWIDRNGRLVGFQNSSCYGVVSAQGQVLSWHKNPGDYPSTWSTLDAATLSATAADDAVRAGEAVWMDPHDWNGFGRGWTPENSID